MRKRLHVKYLFLAGVMSLSGLYFFPLWKISLGVPQYPKEIAIHIWINRIENGTEKALEIMNVLNHNIGMKEIDPASIPELSWFPYILMLLIAAGIVSSFLKDKKFRMAWLVLMILALSLALYDFYLWEYDFGHNLADDAPIKLEKGSFQPPLIGKKIIANFTVTSFPLGGITFPIISTLVSFFSLVKEK